jgi:hypothetical protein
MIAKQNNGACDMAVVLTTASLFCYAFVSSVVNVLDRIPMEHFVRNTCAPSKGRSGRGGYLYFVTVGYAKLGTRFPLYVGAVQSVL